MLNGSQASGRPLFLATHGGGEDLLIMVLSTVPNMSEMARNKLDLNEMF